MALRFAQSAAVQFRALRNLQEQSAQRVRAKEEKVAARREHLRHLRELANHAAAEMGDRIDVDAGMRRAPLTESDPLLR